MSPRAIIFDFDGVILDSVRVKTVAFAKLAEPFGETAVSRMVAFHEANGGISRYLKFEWFFREILGRAITDAESSDWGERFQDLALQGVLEAPYIEGAREFLDTWHSRIPLFVASGTPNDELEIIVNRRGLETHFREVHGTPRKKGEIVRDLLGRHGLGQEEVVFIGDALTDFDAAAECGVPFIGVRAEDADVFPEGTRVIPNLHRLEEAIRSI